MKDVDRLPQEVFLDLLDMWVNALIEYWRYKGLKMK
jgi:hypothetical protein